MAAKLCALNFYILFGAAAKGWRTKPFKTFHHHATAPALSTCFPAPLAE
jgi:hypothetical protein